ncbi:MAG: hypothetical protein R3F19_17150 [Verrucomicrobiales bacterium]
MPAHRLEAGSLSPVGIALAKLFSEIAQFLVCGFQTIEQMDDVADGTEVQILPLAEVFNLTQAGEGRVVEKRRISGTAGQHMNQIGADEFENHLWVHPGEFRRLRKIEYRLGLCMRGDNFVASGGHGE